MKRTLLLWLLVIPSLLIAQGDSKKEKGTFQGALLGGFNATQIDGDDMAGFNSFGANVGAGVYVYFNESVSLSMEITYSMKGANSNRRFTPPDELRSISLDYAEIPVMFNYNDKNIIMFSGGLAIGRLVRYKETFAGDDITATQDEPYSPVELSGILGLTFLIKEHWGINIRAQYSLTKLGEFPESNLRNFGQYNNVLTGRGIYFF